MFRKALIASLSLVCFAAFAAEEVNVVPGLTAVGAPLGLHGVDPVAFIEIGNRSEGSPANTSVHDGVAYYFSSKANLETFEKNPEQYVPQNGGFCTFGVSVGKKFDGNPNYAAVENGKLYVFVNEGIYRSFDTDRAGTIQIAAKKWKSIRSIPAADL